MPYSTANSSNNIFISSTVKPISYNSVYIQNIFLFLRCKTLHQLYTCYCYSIHQRIANRYFLDMEEYDTEDWPDEETIAKMYAFIRNNISPQARQIMELRFSDGIKFSQIAEVMGISETAVYRHLSHALSIIRKKLSENG